jgi:ribosome maturation factor RimP
MIERKRIVELCEEWLKDKEYFLVYTDVTDDKITVEIDHKDGVWINDCAELSRFISEQCEPDIDDYELEVGSAGIGQPFRILQQYINNIGNEVDLLTNAGKKQRGILKSADENAICVEIKEKQKVEGKKRPQMVDVEYKYTYDELKYVKAVLEFK